MSPHFHLLSVDIRNVKFGENAKVIEPVNLYDCLIGDGVFIGSFVDLKLFHSSQRN